MARVRMSPQARRDLFDILQHLSDQAGVSVARKYDTRFKGVVARLRKFPGLGSSRSDLGAETRLVTVDPYQVFYDGGPKSAEVLVLRILHGHRNVTPQLIARGRKP
jgi:plasmid stabilization system protein ParE